jgi:hypothetical protein
MAARVDRGPYAGLTAQQYLQRRNWSIAISLCGLVLVGAGCAAVALRQRSWARWPNWAPSAALGVGGAGLVGGVGYWCRWSPLRLLQEEDAAREAAGASRNAVLRHELVRHQLENRANDWNNPALAREIADYRAQRATRMLRELGGNAVDAHVIPFVVNRIIPAAIAYLFG